MNTILQSALQRIKAQPDTFDQNKWCDPQKTCGCFAWHIVDMHGTPEQRDAYTWDGATNDYIACDVAGIDRSVGKRLFWAMNTVEDITEIINE